MANPHSRTLHGRHDTVARLPRLAVGGALHHVMQRGHDGHPVFRDDADRRLFLSLLSDAARAEAVAVHAYALLDSEIHLLATPAQAANLGRLMQAVGRRYVSAFNRRHQRRGTLWDGRFRSSLIDPVLVLEATIHVECLPVRAQLASAPADWPWSSASQHLGRRHDAVLADHPDYWKIGNTPFERELVHADKLAEGLSTEFAVRFDDALRRGHAVGEAGFVARAELALGRPVKVRARGRPRKVRDS